MTPCSGLRAPRGGAAPRRCIASPDGACGKPLVFGPPVAMCARISRHRHSSAHLRPSYPARSGTWRGQCLVAGAHIVAVGRSRRLLATTTVAHHCRQNRRSSSPRRAHHSAVSSAWCTQLLVGRLRLQPLRRLKCRQSIDRLNRRRHSPATTTASRTGSCDGPWPCRTFCARPPADRGSRSRRA